MLQSQINVITSYRIDYLINNYFNTFINVTKGIKLRLIIIYMLYKAEIDDSEIRRFQYIADLNRINNNYFVKILL